MNAFINITKYTASYLYAKVNNMSASRLLVVSTSTIHSSSYLSYILPEVREFFEGTNEVLFIPYARPSGISHDEYTSKAAASFADIGIQLKGLHTFNDPVKAINEAGGVFTGGGNTFVLLQALYQLGLVTSLREKIKNGMPYMGTSAGSNITGLTIGTTNDMPIVYPPSFEALQVLPFNINPHYLDPDPDSKHMGETRETRIHEFHQFNSQMVVGLREGSWLDVKGGAIVLKGDLSARIFRAGVAPFEVPAGSDLSELI
jgi:dipeptidase E